MAEPTPRPWRLFLQGNNEKIGDHAGRKIAVLCRTADERAANGALIVRAVNAHDDLVAAVKGLIDVIDGAADRFALSILSIEVKKKARAALAKAGAT